jgi:hypothetical protein
VVFDRKNFDHRYTDFSLNRTHRDVSCDKCHLKDKPYHEAQGKCIDCHEKKDVHKGDFGKQCGSCHQGRKWKDVEYDHDKARFKLRFAHREAECKDCHPKLKYKYERRTCDVCHLKDDKHKRKLGLQCEKCHNEKKWTSIKFNHNKDTKYRLKWQHRKAKCLSCHTADPYKEQTTQTCNDCHSKKDEHKGVFGKLCDDCHIERRWKDIRFDHDNTRYVLTGAHRSTDCHGCHRREKHVDLANAQCVDCHLSVDVHEDALGSRCESCHVSKGWILVDKFDHDLSRFPLTGEHIDTLCEECHNDYRYRDTTSRQCKECHFEPKVHQGLFTEACENCHFSTDWLVWRFSHNTQTDFELRGRHQQISCFDCHNQQLGGADIASDCYSCHILDDIHNGEFGKACGQCHSEKTFKGARIR